MGRSGWGAAGMMTKDMSLADRLLATISPQAEPPAGRKPAAKAKRRRDPAHPLADSKGGVYPYRAAAWELFGPGPVSCWRCGSLLWWHRRVAGAALPPWELQVDFADGDRSNVSDENLRASCRQCAAARGRYPRAKENER